MNLRRLIRDWLEWQDAKCWAKEFHPAWVEIVNRTQSETVRKIYRDKILEGYRGEFNGCV